MNAGNAAMKMMDRVEDGRVHISNGGAFLQKVGGITCAIPLKRFGFGKQFYCGLCPYCPMAKQSSGKIRQIATVIPLSLAPLQAASNCPVWSGIGVQFALERVSSLPWNQCPVCRGTGVQFGAENASGDFP